MALRQGDAQFGAVEGHGPQALRQLGQGCANESDVCLARRHLLDQLFHRHAGQEFKRHLPVVVAIAGDQRRQFSFRHYAGAEADAQRAELAAPDLVCLFQRPLGAGKNFLRIEQHRLPSRRKFHTAVDTEEKLEAQILFQLPDTLRYGRLGDAQLQSGRAEILALAASTKMASWRISIGGEVFVL